MAVFRIPDDETSLGKDKNGRGGRGTTPWTNDIRKWTIGLNKEGERPPIAAYELFRGVSDGLYPKRSRKQEEKYDGVPKPTWNAISATVPAFFVSSSCAR